MDGQPQPQHPELIVRALGEPCPQGSKNAFVQGGRAVIVDVNPKPLKTWRATIAETARATARREHWTRLDAAIEVGIVLFLERPKTAPRRRVWPDRKPDIDKLARAVLDALTTSGAIVDDARIVHLDVWKRYAPAGVPLGARIVIRNAVEPDRPVIEPLASSLPVPVLNNDGGQA